MNIGIVATLLAALLFGAGTPLAKLLLDQISPWLLAALLYLGSGMGLWLMRHLRSAQSVRLAPTERAWFVGAVVAGGMVGPALLMLGLTHLSGSSASLLLNAEGVLTALIAWCVFRENVDRRIALGMLAIVAGGVVLSWPQGATVQAQPSTVWPTLAVLGACLAWAIDNNLTRKVSLADASWIATVKGLVAGSTNLVLALAFAQHSGSLEWPGWQLVALAAMLGFASYGASLTLFVVGLRHLGTARTGAYFSVAPFAGAVMAIGLLGDPVTAQLLAAGALMLLGMALHVTEHHAHAHSHTPTAHSHEHSHHAGDLHHNHSHAQSILPGTRHVHAHQHDALAHSHAHFPDAHHQHTHS